ncbi:hypothetical protein [Geminisphaera colitermitum]|uniref:hypothetical protein n=1 Tax=Geminisphaera colitermitum TaxID=1148786 RepID=UPI000196556B|nr:hypothetical protein [Geminisphaera colitermitum]
MKSKNFASALILLITLVLISCMSGCSTNAAFSRMLYQPPTLALPAGQPVQTMHGTYLPQVDEVWHSPARYEAREREAQNLAAALAEERNRNTATAK